MSWLLLRGLAREQRHWHEFPALFRARAGDARVVCLDLAGTGTERDRTPHPSVAWLARDVARRLPGLAEPRSTDTPDWSVLGLSMGGMVALELCRLFPTRLQRAVIVNASSRMTPVHERLQPRGALAIARALLERDPVRRESIVLRLTSNLREPALSEYAALAAEVARDAAPTRWAVLTQLLAAARFRPAPPALPGTRLTFLCGRGDRLVSSSATRDLARWYGLEAIEHPSAGHDLPLDDPSWVCERVFSEPGRTSAAREPRAAN